MVRVRFAPSPTGSLHLGSALTAVANRRFADEHDGTFVLRMDDTDAARNDPGSEAAILDDLRWLDITWDEGPIRQSERGELYRAAADQLLEAGRAVREGDGSVRFDLERRPTLLRPDGTATYQLATVADDLDLRITHVIRGADHRSNTQIQAELAKALGQEPPQYVHHGLILGEDGHKLSKRHGVSALADLREAGIPAEAVRAYLEELGVPRGDVHLDLARVRRLAVEAIAAMSDEELAGRVDASPALAPALRGARDLEEARRFAQAIAEPEPVTLPAEAASTLERFRELRERANGGLDADSARALVRELKAVGGDLRALRLALTGRERGPELWTIVAALPRDEALRRVDAAL
jgi:glutamyl/glutaminyl-tRNA synthetase